MAAMWLAASALLAIAGLAAVLTGLAWLASSLMRPDPDPPRHRLGDFLDGGIDEYEQAALASTSRCPLCGAVQAECKGAEAPTNGEGG